MSSQDHPETSDPQGDDGQDEKKGSQTSQSSGPETCTQQPEKDKIEEAKKSEAAIHNDEDKDSGKDNKVDGDTDETDSDASLVQDPTEPEKDEESETGPSKEHGEEQDAEKHKKKKKKSKSPKGKDTKKEKKEKEKKKKQEKEDRKKEKAKEKLGTGEGKKKKKKKKQENEEKEEEEMKEKQGENCVIQKEISSDNQEFEKVVGRQHSDGKKYKKVASSSKNTIPTDSKDSPSKCDQASGPGMKSTESAGKQAIDEHSGTSKEDKHEKRVDLDKPIKSSTDQPDKGSAGQEEYISLDEPRMSSTDQPTKESDDEEIRGALDESMKSSTDQHVKGNGGVEDKGDDQQEQPGKLDTKDKSTDEKMDTSSVPGEEHSETGSAHAFDKNVKDETPEDWDVEVEVESESGSEQKTMQNTLVIENRGNLEGSPTIDPKPDGDEKGMLSKFVDGAKSLFGYPPKQEIPYSFYVSVQDPAYSVNLNILNPALKTYIATFPMKPLDNKKVYWSLPVSSIPGHLTSLHFCYTVYAEYGKYENPYDSRVIGKPRSHFTVFRYPNFPNDFTTGLFYFARMVYRRFCNKELTLKQSIEEYDHISFGCPDFSVEKRHHVASWIQQELNGIESSEKAIFFAHVIQHFDYRLLQNSKKNNPLLKQLIQDESSMQLIQLLLDNDKNLVKESVFNVGRLVGILLGNVQRGVSIQYAVGLCYFFGVDILEHLSPNSNWNGEEEFLMKEEVYVILHSLHDNDRRRLLGFIVKRAPTISFTSKLYIGVNNSFPSYISSNFEMFKRTFTKLLSVREAGKLPTVLQKTSWESFPKEFKADFVKPFLDALIDQIRRKRSLSPEEENAVIAFFTDEVVLSNEEAKGKFFEASKTPELHSVVISVLQNPNSLKCWQEVKEEMQAEVYRSLIRQAFLPQMNTETGGKKSKVHRVLESLNEIFIALEVCPCPKASESVEAKCLDFFAAEDLNNMTKEFDVVKQFHSDVENIYFVCLQRCIGREVARGHGHDNIVQLLKRLSAEDEGNSSKLKRITHDVLLSLCNETKVLNETGKTGQQDFLKIFHGVFANLNLWSVLMDVMSQWQEESEYPQQLEVLRQAILSFADALKTKDIKIKDLKRLSKETYKELLGKIHEFFCGRKSYLEDLISSCVNQEKNVYEELDQLLKFLNFINKITERTVVVYDIEDVLGETTKKKKNYNDMSLRDVLDEDYWRSAKSLLQSRDLLLDLEMYRVFYNAAQARLEEEMMGDDMLKRCSLEEVTTILTEEGILHLKETCETLFTDPGSLSISDAKCIMNGVTDLKKELAYISTTFEDQEIASDAEDLLQRFLKFPSIHNNVEALDKVLESLNIPHEDDFSEFVEKTLEDYEDLIELYEATEEVVDIEEPLHGSYGEVIKELSVSTELIKLLRETAQDDVRNLIDAVEVHSDTTVAAKEVSDFIEIHKFLSPVLIAEPRDFFKVLTERLQSLGEVGAMGIAVRIKVSGNNAHSLRNIYKNVANRGEMTKEIVSKALKGGKYKINSKGDDQQDNLLIHQERSEEVWEYSLSYQEDDDEEERTLGGKSVKHDLEKLQDLKSRALLIVNTEKKQQSSTEESVDFQSFIKIIDLLNEIVATGEELQRSGHPEYRTYWGQGETLEEIEYICEELKKDLQDWEEIVRSVRDSNFFLNFFHTKQLWVLKEFFDSNDKFEDDAFSLLRLIDNSVTKEEMRVFQAKRKVITNGSYQEQFIDIASRLEEFFGIDFFHGELMEKDEKQGLFVVPLEKDSTKTASVVMQLFENANASPEPKRVLFCHSNSTWYEIDLFLRRCFQENSTSSGPYCLANVESLTTDLQFQLIDSIREFQKSSKTNYWLALICRGGEHHHIVNQFRECTKNIRGMTDVKLKRTFQKLFPNVSMVTSDLPGLGKSEHIHERALENRKRITCFAINGPVSREKLVNRLLELGIDKDCLLHIDISEVDDPLLVDTFLFELIVLGMVSSGTKLFHIPSRFIAIEVANTLQHSLRDSLSVTKCFERIHKEWSFENFMCSQENGSAVQVVCQYLRVYDNQTLEKESLTLKDLKEATPLKESECRDLISKHFRSTGDLCYNVIETFLNVLATQLRKFSASLFFRPEHLKDMLGEGKDVRVSLFEALKNVSVEFATRSVGACKEVQALALQENDPHPRVLLPPSQKAKSAAKMVDRVEGMVKWADENHLVVMFQEAFSISALFRELGKVPEQVKALFENQNAPLRDLGKLDQEELKDKLKKILFADTRNRSQEFDSLTESYVLTPDNVLKMVLIIQRIRAGVPVIVMGETGCGKTSLVRYLANSCGIPMKNKVLNFHAGIYEKDIVEFTQKQVREAQKELQKQVWVFFDEINTCDYLGLINDIICHRTLNGKELPPNLMFIAACNPYCLRPTDSIVTAGLTGKSVTDEYSNLVYRVKPLPETMMDYVWDYGSLDPKDERAYIERMVDELEVSDTDLVDDLLATSQAFIREVEGNPYCVSLRDVRRCILLAKWFMKMINDRPELDVSRLTPKARNNYLEAKDFEVEDRAIILALAHAYQCRIPSSEKRKEYRLKLEGVYTKHHKGLSATELDLIIRAEQEEYLARMELPDGTARNTALRENVFVILVCILNRIPVFVVGKPGCSKSLSMQVIRSNLRGKDSKDEFFKTLPQLLVVSYQGSESSTSEGILKVFEKAEKYKEHNKQDESIPVVLLDEVGLAEISKYNPLKVLHRLLEPEDQEFPNVAVVGISNWALDAAKMNRAIHLSRPEPTYEDLKETGISILEAQLHTLGVHVREKAQQGLSEEKLGCLAQSYYEYQKNQIHENFHGLRDYYSLIKCLSRSLIDAAEHEESESFCNTFRALQRNFGGLMLKDKTIDDIYADMSESLHSSGILETREEFPVTDLISDNLDDPSARHLMLITSGDSALTIMDKTLSDLSREKVIIYGSKFEEDISEDYSYRILSRIILHMERDCVLVLRDLESVYGSLYDMLNQNYVVVGKKKNCRVALGPYSNPMCQVHDGFRCIVLVDEDKVDYTDPPFLNRFEKQLLRYSDVLKEDELRVIEKLKRWTKGFCKIEKKDFKERDVFLGFDNDTLASLVLLLRQRSVPSSELFQVCKNELMAIATPEGVLRSLRSELFKDDPVDVREFYDRYFFKTPVHNGLKGFIDSFKPTTQAESTLEYPSLKYFVMTHSSIHTDVEACLKGSFTCQVEKLGAFKSEKQLSKHIQMFWSSSDKDLLVFQCKPNLDGEHISLMKSIIEQQHERYFKSCLQEDITPTKSVCIIIHLQKGEPSGKAKQWQFNFLMDWKQATLDSLEEPEIPISMLLGKSVFDLMKSKKLSLKKIIADKLMWCFTRLKYPPNLSDQESLDRQVTQLQSSKMMMGYLEKIVLRWIHQNHDKVKEGEFWSSNLSACDWQINVSCDKKALLGSLAGALQRYIDQLVRRPLAKAVYLIANRLTFDSCQRALRNSKGKNENERFLAELIQDEDLFNIDEVPDPQDAKCYVLTQTNCSLNFPFSIIFFERIGHLREKYLEKWRERFQQEEVVLESEAVEEAKEEFFQELCTDIKNTVPQLFGRNWLNENLNEYIEDVFDYFSVQHSSNLSHAQRIMILKAACVEHLDDTPGTDVALLLTKIHFSLWKHGSSFLSILQFLSICPSIFVRETENLSKKYIKVFGSIVRNAKKLEVGSRNEEEEEADESFGTDDKKNEPLCETEELGEPLPTAQERTVKNEGSENDDEESNDSDEEDADDNEDEEHEEDNESDGDNSDDAEESDDESSEDDSEGDDDNDESGSDDSDDDSEDGDEEHPDPKKEPRKEENEEENDEEIDNTTEPFMKVIFETLCKRLIPTDDLLRELGNLQTWQTAANSFVSLVTKSSLETSRLFYNLRVCSDFANMVLSPTDEKPFPLYFLGELSQREGDQGDLHNCFDRVLDIMDDVESTTNKADEFKISFLWRCLGTCESEEQFQGIFSKACTFPDKETLALASPLICEMIILGILSEGDAPFMEVLEDLAGSSDYSFLPVLEKALTSAAEESNGVQDCYLATICLEAFDRLTQEDLDFGDSEVSSSTSSTVKCLNTAMGVVKEPRKNQDILKLLTAVSYVRNSLTSVAELVLEDPMILKQETGYSSLLKYISSCLEAPRGSATDNPRKASCMLYFLRLLRQELSLYELRRLCEDSPMLPVLTRLTWSDEISKVPIKIFIDVKMKEEFDSALFKLIDRGDSNTMKTLCSKLATDAKSRKAFACSLIEGLYLSHSIQVDTVNKAVDSIIKFLPKKLASIYKQLVFCLTGKEDFKGKELRVSAEVPLSSLRKATIVLHLLAILTSECSSPVNIDRPFFSYLLDPSKAAGGYVLAQLDPLNEKPPETLVVSTCSCRTAFLRSDQQPNCPQCNKPCSTPKEKGTVKSSVVAVPDELSVYDMSPSSFRLLRIFVNAALFAGISLDAFSREKLANFLSFDRDRAHPVQQCLTAIDDDLEVLKRLWGFNEEQVVSTVHLLIEETSGLLTKPMGGAQLTDQSRKEMQKAFSDTVNQFFKSQKDSDRSQQNKDVRTSSLEAQIEEQDLTEDFTEGMRNSWLPRLFRFTKQKSLNDLCASYNKVSETDKKSHGLLGLFIQYMKVLPKIGHLYPLIKFSNMLDRHFGRRLSRKDSEKLIGDLIKEDSKHNKDLKKSMTEFLSSWENVRSVIEGDTMEEVPHLTKMSSVSYFLVDQGFHGQYLYKAILALQRIQNEFQGKVLKLALEGSCPALDFLKRSDSSGCSSSVPIVHVQDVKRGELICFEWDDEILSHSYHDTEYGKGHEIHYDFGKIESELAGRYLIGKVYLSTDGGLRQFPYSNELFHTCANVLNDISERLPQKPLNADQQSRLSVLRDKKIKGVQDLLDHLEVIICWLSKTSFFSPQMNEMPLVDYVTRKLPSSNLLPKKLFEDPQKEFQLRHVVSMYQKLEEFLAEASAETVPDKYRKPLSEEGLQKLTKVFGSIDQKVVVVTTLRRFIFRYLLSDQDHQDTWDPQENAVKYLDDPSLWPLDLKSDGCNEGELMVNEFDEEEPRSALQDLVEKFIPRSMLVCEVYSVMSFYDKAIKESKQKQIEQQASPRKQTRRKTKLAASLKVSGFA